MLKIKLLRVIQLLAIWSLFVTSHQAWASSQSCASTFAPDDPIVDIGFKDFFKQPIGPAGLEFTEKLLSANGKHVCIQGYMVKQESPPTGKFILAPLALEMHEHSDGEADDLPVSAIVVHLDESQKNLLIPHEPGLLAINGKIKVGRHEDENGRVAWIVIQLAADQIKTNETASPSSQNHSHKH